MLSGISRPVPVLDSWGIASPYRSISSPTTFSIENGRISVARTRRTIDVEFDEATLIYLVDGLSSGLTFERLMGALPLHLRDAARDIVADLIGWEAVVAGTGARSRLAHEWSMRGARARGRLSPSEVAALTFGPRTHGDEDATIMDLAAPRPFPIDSLSRVLRQRRSPASYDSSPILVDHLGQLLGGACGITGELVMADRRLPLRAYPSPGALYAVDIYIIPTRVEGLPNGVFRYDPERHALVTVHDRRVDPVLVLPPRRSRRRERDRRLHRIVNLPPAGDAEVRRRVVSHPRR